MPKKAKNSEDEIQKAVQAYHARKKPKIAPLAREFSVSYSQLYARIHGRGTHSDRTDRTKALNPNQETALISWVKLLDSSLIEPTPEEIENTANRLLKRAGADHVVGHNWVYRFIQRLPPTINYLIQKPKEKARMESENIESLSLWFYHFSKVVEEHQFLPHEIYNWDETGYQIGQGKARKVVSSRTTSSIATGGLAESISGIECIAADGWVMLPWFLVKGTRQMEEWYTSIKIPDFRIKPTPKGYIDDETAFEWLCCFHEATKTRVQKGRPRLLLMDNHPSHTTIEFTTFCKEKFIIPIWFLPHTTHLCQPLDGQAFQCIKHYFRKANNEVLNTKLLNDLAELDGLSARIQRRIRRSIDANELLSQRLAMTEESLKKSQSYREDALAPKNRRSILNAGPMALSPAGANRMIKRRQDADDKKFQRQQAKHAKKLELEQQAQLAREAADAEQEARLAARDSRGANWYIDTTGVYR
ncbi:hypothetical protein N7489_005065 [Penicillium chrysogenum]|uniref:uncharacterized protein n=1 Tax=Penicillium chrysogenum TaxID=5076 RepID=UPI0024DF0F02|nr:uncharacterized protein N7489_005065 [Penicillium chrysogenum]KAJ5244969.1 hypothetical protein N7489_005065 [Penicillium chrysogenum]